ncbi:restriction endonuclease subunit S [Arthrobacter sp. NQ4]|uniref:restriction endonuclease subunit S n=1 Tax=Arthrobacter sp. NQ4 TaxID=3027930 RepID=UPI0023B19C1A|nr:restriction endonuclease subunit S [Arthrobacter sp. NQ4]MDE8588952.1 restriction endonuclease subunit S [Arthrobacter sp. NQ4]
MKVRLGSILKEFKAKPPKGSNPEVLTLTERNGFVRQADRFNKRLATEDVSGYKYIELDDFAFNPYLLWAGAIARNGHFANGVISPLYPTFRLSPGNHAGYVERLVLSRQLISAYDNIAFGSVPRRRRSSVKDFLDLEVPALPPLDEQRRIAAILDKADELRIKRRETLAHLDSLIQSIFHAMFDQFLVDTAATVGSTGLVQLGRQRAPKYQSGNHTRPYMRVANVKLNELDLSDVLQMDFDEKDFKAYQLNYGDILLNEGQSTELVGRPAMWRDEIEDCCFQNTLVRYVADPGLIVPEFALATFLYYFHRGEFAKISSKTSSIAHLGAARFARMPMPTPPLELQQKFARRVSAVERLKDIHRKHLAELEALFASLQHRAFKGEL